VCRSVAVVTSGTDHAGWHGCCTLLLYHSGLVHQATTEEPMKLALEIAIMALVIALILGGLLGIMFSGAASGAGVLGCWGLLMIAAATLILGVVIIQVVSEMPH
jgi:hypothetical protein